MLYEVWSDYGTERSDCLHSTASADDAKRMADILAAKGKSNIEVRAFSIMEDESGWLVYVPRQYELELD